MSGHSLALICSSTNCVSDFSFSESDFGVLSYAALDISRHLCNVSQSEIRILLKSQDVSSCCSDSEKQNSPVGN